MLVVDIDEQLCIDVSVEGLVCLNFLFDSFGFVIVGNVLSINDGVVAVMMMSEVKV